jgi:hypothetical protein
MFLKIRNSELMKKLSDFNKVLRLLGKREKKIHDFLALKTNNK